MERVTRQIIMFLKVVLLKALPYFGAGFLFNAIFNGPMLDWNNSWTWAYVLAWPATLGITFLIAFFYYGVILAIIVGCIFLAWKGLDNYILVPRREMKRRKIIELRRMTQGRYS